MHKLGFIFDMDGTMIDSMGYHAKSWALFCEAHGLTHPLTQSAADDHRTDLRGVHGPAL